MEVFFSISLFLLSLSLDASVLVKIPLWIYHFLHSVFSWVHFNFHCLENRKVTMTCNVKEKRRVKTTMLNDFIMWRFLRSSSMIKTLKNEAWEGEKLWEQNGAYKRKIPFTNKYTMSRWLWQCRFSCYKVHTWTL